MGWLTRRAFLAGASATVAGCVLPSGGDVWHPGELRITFFNTGVGESMFWVLPDGTSVLLDCGDPSIATEAHGRHHVLTVIVPRGGTAFHIQNEELP